MQFNLQRLRANVQAASTEDLLDRATVYRSNLEPAAVPVILEELRVRGISAEAIIAHESTRWTGRTCDRCFRPAVSREWGWHRLFGKVPVFPWLFYLCEGHRAHGGHDNNVPEDAGDPRSGTN
jgi:hypothetical protein